MAWSASRTILSLAFVFLTMLVPATAADQKRVALVVGNSAYANATALPNTINDAKAVEASLTRLGFQVFAAYDATQDQLLTTLADFTEALDGADAGAFFYAGHGIQIGSENYMLPVDISIESELSVRYGSVGLSDVVRDIERMSRVAIIMLDACRNNPFAAQLAAASPSRALSIGQGLAPIAASGDGTLISYAAAPGMVASDGSGDHSPYTKALIEEIEKPGIEIGLMFRRVAGRVIEESAGQQRPEVVIRLASEFYLAGLPPQPIAVADNAPAPAQSSVPPPVDLPIIETAALTPAPGEDVPLLRETGETNLQKDRAALWGYMANYLATPVYAPLAGWRAPEPAKVAELEPNSSFGGAQQVNVNDEVTLTIAPARDRDWVRFTVGQAGVVSVRSDAPPAEVQLSARLVSADFTELVYWSPAPRPGGALDLTFDLPKPGTYYIEFADQQDSGWSPAAFPVTLVYAAAGDGFEPNNGIHLARHLPLNGTAEIAMLPKGDQDWFRYETDAPGALFVSLTGVPETVDPSFRLLNSDGAEQVYWINAPRPGGDNSAVLDLPRPGVYYLQVVDNNNDASSERPMTLASRFAPSPDLYEPNNSIVQAMPVEPNSRNEMALFPRGDGDWLAVDVSQPGELTLDITAPPENLDLAFRVLDVASAEVQSWTYAPRPGGDVGNVVDIGKPGRYFIQIVDNNNDAGSVEPYALDLGFTASLDSFEPNDGIGSARPLTPGGEVQFTILPRADTDWFRVSVEQPGALAITIDESPQNLDLYYRVLNTDWTELQYWVAPYAMGGLTEGEVDLPRAGTYFIQVTDGNNDARSIDPATLRTVFTPTFAAQEPNNTFGEAVPVDISGETTAHILPRGDTDWQVFHADGPGRLDVTIDEVPETLDIAFRVLDADQREVQSWINAPRPGGVTTGSVTIPAAGWYWLQIADANNDGRSPLPFRVTRVFTGG